MAISDWSTTASSNSTIDGINIAEGCAAGNLNNAIRSVMAGVRGSISTFWLGVLTAADAASARLGLGAAASGANADITSLQSSCTATTQTANDNSTKIATTAYADAAASAVGGAAIGKSQTWQDVTASRSSGTPYTNSTGKPIQIAIAASSGAGGCSLMIDSVSIPIQIGSASYYAMNVASFIIPNGSTYSATGSFSNWLELR